MENEITTTDLAKFGARERAIVADLLNAWDKDGLPSDFCPDHVRPMFNTESGYVFLSNDEHEVAVMENGKLVSFYSLPYAGIEGTLEELKEEFEGYGDTWHLEDVQAFNNI